MCTERRSQRGQALVETLVVSALISTLASIGTGVYLSALDKARGTRDEKELAKLYKTFQQYAVEDVPGVIAYVMNFGNAYRNNVKGFRTHSYLWLDLRNTTVE